MSDESQPLPRRVNYLDGLRAAAAFFVLVHHAMMMAFPISLGKHPTGALGYAIGWATYGHFGVTVFIVLAGYSLFLAVARKEGVLPGGLWGYFRRRAWRILPPYWIALAFTIVLVVTFIGRPTGTHWDLSVPQGPRIWAVNALLLQDAVHQGRYAAYTFWSVAVEWHVYLLVPLILLVRRRSTWPIAVVAVVLLGGVGVLAAIFIPVLGRFHFEYYLLFALAAGGCLVVQLEPRWRKNVPWKAAGVMLAVPAFVMTAVHSYSWAERWFPLLDLLVGGSVLCFLVSLGTGSADRLARLLAWKPLAAAGAFSYTLYLVHAQLLQLFWQAFILPQHLAAPMNLLIGWGVAVPIVAATSWLFSLAMERPFIRREERKRARQLVG